MPFEGGETALSRQSLSDGVSNIIYGCSSNQKTSSITHSLAFIAQEIHEVIPKAPQVWMKWCYLLFQIFRLSVNETVITVC